MITQKNKVTGFLFLFYLGTISLTAEQDAPQAQILYIRHGEVPGNDSHDRSTYLYTGCRTDESLTEKGRDQANQCAMALFTLQKEGRIDKITAIYASNLKRARETAAPIGEMLGLDVHVRHNLREIDWGCAEGQLVQKMADEWEEKEDRIHSLYPDRTIRWDHLPVFEGAETYNALLYRTLEELKMIIEHHETGTMLIIGHGRVLKTLIAHAKDSEKEILYPSNCGIAEFSYSSKEGLRFIKILR